MQQLIRRRADEKADAVAVEFEHFALIGADDHFIRVGPDFVCEKGIAEGPLHEGDVEKDAIGSGVGFDLQRLPHRAGA